MEIKIKIFCCLIKLEKTSYWQYTIEQTGLLELYQQHKQRFWYFVREKNNRPFKNILIYAYDFNILIGRVSAGLSDLSEARKGMTMAGEEASSVLFPQSIFLLLQILLLTSWSFCNSTLSFTRRLFSLSSVIFLFFSHCPRDISLTTPLRFAS